MLVVLPTSMEIVGYIKDSTDMALISEGQAEKSI